MCGITGSVRVGDRTRLERIPDLLRHRGPDDGNNEWIDEDVFFGHRRLKVIDLSEAGRQPMCNEDENVWIVYNGEIYNYLELKERLLEKGHRFKSETDTEVIVHLYEEKREQCFADLNGMFALAIYDKARKKLILARDRLGIKPIYYWHVGGRFVFGSEIKTILGSGVYSPDVNWQGVYDYFTYLFVPCPQTIYEGILQVPPGHVLEFDVGTREVRLWRYWEMTKKGNWDFGKGKNRSEEMRILRDLLIDSVTRQMISDVPLGIFLSGGVDSPILTGIMAMVSPQPIKTFTVTFEGKGIEFYSEREMARRTAQFYGTDHHEVNVNITNPMEMLELIDFFDQPFGNPTFYLMHLISKFARSAVTVALCGAGGDELFGGYPRYQAAMLARWMPKVLFPFLNRADRVLGIVSDDYRTPKLRRIRQYFRGLDRDFSRQFVKWTYFCDAIQKRRLLRETMGTSECGESSLLPSERIIRQYLEDGSLNDVGNRILYADIQTFLVDNILEYTDKMSMAVGLEVRVPYLDHRIVEHSLTIPFRRKVRNRKTKVILKEAFADLLPRINSKTPKKGFNAPLAVWMRDYLDRYFEQHMGRIEVERHGIFDWEYIQRLRQLHRDGKSDNSYELFSIIMFDVWLRKYILGVGIPEVLA